MFIKGKNDTFIIVLVYVVDIILIGPNPTLINMFKQFLHNKFQLKDLDNLKYFLKLKIDHYKQGITLTQHLYTLTLLEDVGGS